MSTNMPHRPKITLGTAASISMIVTTGCRSLTGAISVRKAQRPPERHRDEQRD